MNHKWVVDINSSDFERYKFFACIYCGNTTSKTRDHVISVSWSGHKRQYNPGETVKCCLECNVSLSNKPFFSISNRANYLSNYYTKKYSKLLTLPFWSDEELNSLSRELNIMVGSAVNLKNFILARIAHCTLTALDDLNLNIKQIKNDDVLVYKILDECKKGAKYKDVEKKFNLTKGVREILQQKKYTNLVITFKYQNNIPFDYDIFKYFKQIRNQYKR